MKRFAVAAAIGLAVVVQAAATPVEPEAFRNEDYRSPTPATLKGGHVLSGAEALKLWQSKAALFIDVLPQAPKPKNLPKDVLWRDPAHDDIPGSVWLPDTGYGELAPAMRDYFVANLSKAGDRPLVFYCKRDCWMSWNAAKRALTLGFKQVYWFPDGVDGWREAGLPLEARKAEPRPP